MKILLLLRKKYTHNFITKYTMVNQAHFNNPSIERGNDMKIINFLIEIESLNQNKNSIVMLKHRIKHGINSAFNQTQGYKNLLDTNIENHIERNLEISESLQKYGLKLGAYMSQDYFDVNNKLIALGSKVRLEIDNIDNFNYYGEYLDSDVLEKIYEGLYNGIIDSLVLRDFNTYEKLSTNFENICELVMCLSQIKNLKHPGLQNLVNALKSGNLYSELYSLFFIETNVDKFLPIDIKNLDQIERIITIWADVMGAIESMVEIDSKTNDFLSGGINTSDSFHNDPVRKLAAFLSRSLDYTINAILKKHQERRFQKNSEMSNYIEDFISEYEGRMKFLNKLSYSE